MDALGLRNAMRKKVLIVDDALTVRTQLVGILSGDFDCSTAENGQEGFEKALGLGPDAMVVDLEMPEVGGVELLRLLHGNQRTRTIPVIIATTVTSLDRVNECRALGCAGYVLKPVQGDYLLAKLRKLTSVKLV
ncbi:MAG TPA: response regulator [Myxococcaceae bacterium]|nr:response regulator [Myxococcaceae bacterium]